MKIVTSLITAFALMLITSSVQAGQPEKTVNMAVFWLDGNIEPTSGWQGWALSRLGVGENLIQIDENLNYKPVVAESWKQLDELTTEFTIRDGVRFHSGRVADADAVKASLERALSITDRKDLAIPVAAIQAQGNKLTIKTTRPYAILLNALADPVFIVVDVLAASENPEGFKYQPVATGPFKVARFSPETGLALTKHAGHWSGEPQIDSVNVKYISDPNTRSLALQSGELDLAAQLSPSDLSILEKDDKLVVLAGPNLRTFFIRSNLTKPWMKVLAFRQAVHHAIHKDIYAEKIAGGIPARGPFNQLLPFGYEGEDPYAYDKARAIQLLDNAGFIDTDGDGIREFDGNNIVLQYVSMASHGAQARNIGIAMQSELKKVGIGMEVSQVENYIEAAKQGKYDFLYERWTSAPTLDPQYFLEVSFKSDSLGNSGAYSNPKFDALLDELDHSLDKQKRIQLGREGAKILMDDVAAIFLFYQKGNVVYNKRISGVYRFISEVYYIDERLKLANE